MSEELIKRLRTEYTMCSIVDGLEDVAAVLKDAIDALSRPAPVQVPSGWKLVPSRCPLCEYQHGHQIGCENNPVDIALRAAAPSAPAAPAVDTQRIMGLVENYGDAMFAAGISCAHHEHRNERDYRDDADEAKAQIRAMLTPAIANQEAQDGR